MKKLYLFILLIAGLAFSGTNYRQDRILFALQKDLPDLQISQENGMVRTNIPALNTLLEKYQVTRLGKWLRSADNTDIVGEVNLSKIYSAVFTGTYSWDELQSIKADFAQIAELHSADLESMGHISTTPQVDAYTPNDPRYNEQWYVDRIQANYAWGLWNPETPGSPEVLVGVVDTGVDTEHPDLDGVLYVNPGEDINHDGVFTSADENGVDDDGNGYVDDVVGWDFADNDNDIRPPDAGPDHELSHGTHCTGIIGAAANNSEGIVGVSFRSKVIATKNAYNTATTNPGIVSGYDGILYCAKLGAKIISCSWGGGYLFSYEKNILDDVSDNYGAIVVAAAGNDSRDNDTNPQYPSDYSKCIAVAATNRYDHLANYSNWGSVIDISAPGGEGATSADAILSTIHWNAGGYEAWQGTSMATPVVSGAFALLKAWFPSASRQWLWDDLLDNADPIDDINPDYAGELGSGRVNIYNAIGRNVFPYLTIRSYSYPVTGDDGDGQLNPGESANLVLTIKDDELWQDAQSTTVTLSTNSPYISFTDANASLGNIAAGDSVTTTSGDLVFTIAADAPLQDLPIAVKMEANPTADHPYSFTDTILVHATLNQTGFPVTKIAMPTPLAAADIIGDAAKEIIAVGDDDSVYAYYADGTLLSGFPVYMGAYTTMAPAIADVDNDGNKEIVVCERVNGYLKVIRNDGTLLLDYTVGQKVYGEISLANMDSDDDLEIVFGTYSEKKVHVLNIDGTEIPGFPTGPYPSLINQNIAIDDLDGDGNNDLVFGLFNTDLYAIDHTGADLPNFPVNLDSRINRSPIIADVKGSDKQIIVSTVNKKIQRVDLTGTVQMQYTMDGNATSTPALADFNKDGNLEIAFGTDDSKLHVIDFAGDTLAPFPITLSDDANTSPVFSDLDNDNVLEMLISTADGYVHVLEPDASEYKNFPATYNGALDGSGCVADLDNDGDMEYIFGGDNGINVLDIKDAKGSQSGLWQTYHAHNTRTAYYYYDPSASAIENSEVLPKQFELRQNYPNPFNPSTTIRYELPQQSRVELTIYSVTGQKIVTLINGRVNAGVHHVQWDGRNAFGQSVASGIYFYRFTYKANAQSGDVQRKMVYLR